MPTRQADPDNENLPLTLFNYHRGGVRADGKYDFTSLIRAFIQDPNPAMIFLCGVTSWRRPGRAPFLAAMNELSVLRGRPYVGELLSQTPSTAVVYDPTVFCLDAAEEPGRAGARGGARFHLRNKPSYSLRVFVEDWSTKTTAWHQRRARLLARYGMDDVPTVIAGTLGYDPTAASEMTIRNSTNAMVYRHLDQEDADNRDVRADIRGLEQLIGNCDESSAKRSGAAGYFDIADLDPHALSSSTSTFQCSHGRRTDHILANHALVSTVELLPGSYVVHDDHDPATSLPLPLHARISCTFRIRARTTSESCVR